MNGVKSVGEKMERKKESVSLSQTQRVFGEQKSQTSFFHICMFSLAFWNSLSFSSTLQDNKNHFHTVSIGIRKKDETNEKQSLHKKDKRNLRGNHMLKLKESEKKLTFFLHIEDVTETNYCQ